MRFVIAIGSSAGVALLLSVGTAHAHGRPAPATAQETHGECTRASSAACVHLARSMGGGGRSAHGASHTSAHSSAKSSSNPSSSRFTMGLGKNNKSVINNRMRATDGNVTTGPNVAVARDINDRRAAVVSDGRVVVRNDRQPAVVRDGHVIVLNNAQAAALNGRSGVIIRFHGG